MDHEPDHDSHLAIGDLLVHAAPSPPADADRVVLGAMTRGRTLRRRRRAASLLAAAAVVGVVGTGGALLAPGGGEQRAAGVAGRSLPTPVTASTLASLLPPGKVSDLEDRSGPDLRRGGLLYDGTRVFVYVYRAASCNSGPLITDLGCFDLEPGATEPDTNAVTETSPAPGGLDRVHAEADYVRPDGWRVAVVATNDAAPDGPVVQQAPALTRPQLLEIARAGVWLPEPAAAPTAPAPDDAATRITTAPREVPGTVARILDRQGAGPLRTDPAESSYGDARQLTAHFSWQGTLASVIIEAAGSDPQGACAAGGPGTTCTTDSAGDPVLTWGPTGSDQVTGQGVTVWRRGYAVSVLSYNAADGKDVAPLMAAPPLSIDDLTRVAEDDAWFD
jgi:hypothetical protein